LRIGIILSFEFKNESRVFNCHRLTPQRLLWQSQCFAGCRRALD
jgi:hypothetical protein